MRREGGREEKCTFATDHPSYKLQNQQNEEKVAGKVTQTAIPTLNPFLPSLATAVLACWPGAAAENRLPESKRLLTDCLNPKGY